MEKIKRSKNKNGFIKKSSSIALYIPGKPDEYKCREEG